MKELHECKSPMDEMKYECYSSDAIAIEKCYERIDGTLWITNGDYHNQVNYCPFCGYKAKKQIGVK